MRKSIFKHQRPKQQGVVLLTSMIFLLILTIIVITVMRNATLEERMASNTRNRQLSLQSAEAVIREIESTIPKVDSTKPFDPYKSASFTTACSSGLCDSRDVTMSPKWKNSDAWWASSANTAVTSSSFTGASPRYIVELIDDLAGGQAGKICPIVSYRITSRGQGNDGSVVFVQSVYKYRPNSCR